MNPDGIGVVIGAAKLTERSRRLSRLSTTCFAARPEHSIGWRDACMNRKLRSCGTSDGETSTWILLQINNWQEDGRTARIRKVRVPLSFAMTADYEDGSLTGSHFLLREQRPETIIAFIRPKSFRVHPRCPGIHYPKQLA